MSYPVLTSIVVITLILIGILGYFINQQKNIKRKLKEANEAREKAESLAKLMSEEKTAVEEILQGIQDGIITVNSERLIISTNRRALEMLNTAGAAIKNKYINQVIPIQDIPKNPNEEFEFSSVTYDGKKARLKLTCLPLRSWDNKVKGLIYILEDITKEKELSDMKLDFVAIAAHHLRTPLTIVRSYLAVLYDMIYNKLNQEEQRYLDRIKIGAEQLVSLIEDFLTVSRIEQDEMVIRPAPTDLEKLVAQTVDQIVETAKRSNITLNFVKPDHPCPPVLIDQNLISAALTNLLVNAIEFSYPGGIVTIQMQNDQARLIVHVIDHGKGISTADTPFIFSKFFKAVHHLAQGSKGSGLGLYITKSIIDAHHGKIWFNSIEGRGSTFSFSLPINMQEQIAQNNPPPSTFPHQVL